MNVSVFGMGYVGSVSAACMASLGHSVIGVDIKQPKVDYINKGKAPLIERGLDELLSNGVNKGLISATTDSAFAVKNTDITFISVGTPSKKNGKGANLSILKNVIKEISRNIKNKDYHVIVIRSTIFPGTCEEIIIPTIEKISGGIHGKDFDVISNPEFLREGSAIKDYLDPPFTLLGGNSDKGLSLLEKFYSGIDARIYKTSFRVAEMLKFANNSFHALKVSFANEIGNTCEAYGIDSHEVMDLFCKDDKLNISPYYLKPGFAFGGSCLPKDLAELLSQSKAKGLSNSLLDSVLRSNQNQIERAFKIVQSLKSKKVGFLGLTFKEGTDDLRNSPVVTLLHKLLDERYNVQIYDSNVQKSLTSGRSRAFIEDNYPEVISLLKDDLNEVVESSEIVIVGVRNIEFIPFLESCNNQQTVVDLVRITNPIPSFKAKYIGICW
tara:strand:+ start:521 stop:1837 length:1317 start_codon:yes stop_codon:yes gene_type:complete